MDQVRKILFPVDFSARSLSAAKQVRVWASRLSAEVVAVHVVDPANFSNSPDRFNIQFEEHARFYTAEARRQIDFFCKEQLPGLRTSTSVFVGSVSEILSETAFRESIDLIMIPRVHDSYVSRWFHDPVLSSVLDKCPMPVWTTEHHENLTDLPPRTILCPLDIYADAFLDAAPGTMQPVIVWDEEFGMRTLRMMFWRFLPPFVTDPKKFKLDTINAKSETILDSKMWRDSFLHRRCLVPVDNFIEWHRVDTKTKLPWMFGMKNDSPFALGGVWRHWRSGKSAMDTFAVITVEPNELLAETTHHDRMPLILERKDFQRWFQLADVQQPPLDLLRPFNADKMKAWRVGRRINSTKNNDATLSEPVKEDPEGQWDMFEARLRKPLKSREKTSTS